MRSPKPSLFQDEQSHISQLFPVEDMNLLFIVFWPLIRLSPDLAHFLPCSVEPRPQHSTPRVASPSLHNGEGSLTSLNLLTALLLTLAWNGKKLAHIYLVFSLASSRTHRSFSAVLLSRPTQHPPDVWKYPFPVAVLHTCWISWGSCQPGDVFSWRHPQKLCIIVIHYD